MATLTIQPRLQVELFSLVGAAWVLASLLWSHPSLLRPLAWPSYMQYWKEPLSTETKCLPSFVVEAPELSATVADLMVQAGLKLGWQPVGQLVRLDGFNDDWERAICRGTLG